jgi:peptidoglycan/xylan/chitin deacetylase (PgdA/CDA1 family)
MKRLTFTFDNGPTPGATGEILNFLASHSIKSTLFVTGACLRNPQSRRLAERARAEGHWIGNHTFSHGIPLGLDGPRARVEREIGEMQDLLGDLAHPLKLFRPNGSGRLGPHVLSRAAITYLIENKYSVVTWNNAPGDWKEPHRAWIEPALAALAATDWSVLVLHDQFIGRMMDTLSTFYDCAMRMGVEIRQDFPLACLPVKQGEVVGDLTDLVVGEGAADARLEASYG